MGVLFSSFASRLAIFSRLSLMPWSIRCSRMFLNKRKDYLKLLTRMVWGDGDTLMDYKAKACPCRSFFMDARRM